ncbi:endogenous retrovirus group K member 13-1 Env polyprotein-like [Kogia breviceps]|uniref:endogenous retrovirus group K member 13-1 Env polyprotein-like n=1 Tax=Kogia breviceps TaxID=27615 RepID=UPI0034D26D53
MALLQARRVETKVYWAYLPDPATVRVVTWDDPTPRVHTNMTGLFGGIEDLHIEHAQHPFNWTSFAARPPICFQAQSNTKTSVYGCVMTTQTSHLVRIYPKDEEESNLWDFWSIQEVSTGAQPNRTQLGVTSLSLPSCYNDYAPIPEREPIWRECMHPTPQLFSPYGIPSFAVSDWSKSPLPAQSRFVRPDLLQQQYGAYRHNYSIPGSILSTPGGMYHPDLWKLGAAMAPLQTNYSGSPHWYEGPLRLIFSQACVPRPFFLVVGMGEVRAIHDTNGAMYKIVCNNCVLTNCLPVKAPSSTFKQTLVFLAMQPPYVMVPVEVEGPWYTDYRYQFALELHGLLSRTRRFIGLWIAGIATLISLIATATVSTIALSQTVHTAEHVNNLAQNVSHALATLDRIDHKIFSRLEGLEEAVEFLGKQLTLLKTQMSLICHGGFQYICVTPLEFQNTTSWYQVQRHLQGIWHHTDMSLDLQDLQRDIKNIGKSRLDLVSPAKIAQKVLDQLNGFYPFNLLQYSMWFFIGILALLICLGIIWCCFWSCWKRYQFMVQAQMPLLHLKTIGGDVERAMPVKGIRPAGA